MAEHPLQVIPVGDRRSGERVPELPVLHSREERAVLVEVLRRRLEHQHVGPPSHRGSNARRERIPIDDRPVPS